MSRSRHQRKAVRVLPVPVGATMRVLSPRAMAGSDEESIRGLRTASNKAIAASDIAGFAASLEPGFVVVTGNGTFLSREAYIAVFAKDFEDPHSVRFERIVDSVEISSSVPL